MPATFTITPAVAADLPAVVDLCMLVEAQHEAYNPARWETRPNIRAGYLRWMTGHLDDPQMLILAAKARQPGTPVIGALLAVIEEEMPIYDYTHYAFIHDLAVVDAYRRQGVAKGLLDRTRRWAQARGVAHVRLMVAAQNTDAEVLFRAAGYQETYHEMILPLKSRAKKPTTRDR